MKYIWCCSVLMVLEPLCLRRFWMVFSKPHSIIDDSLHIIPVTVRPRVAPSYLLFLSVISFIFKIFLPFFFFFKHSYPSLCISHSCTPFSSPTTDAHEDTGSNPLLALLLLLGIPAGICCCCRKKIFRKKATTTATHIVQAEGPPPGGPPSYNSPSTPMVQPGSGGQVRRQPVQFVN